MGGFPFLIKQKEREDAFLGHTILAKTKNGGRHYGNHYPKIPSWAISWTSHPRPRRRSLTSVCTAWLPRLPERDCGAGLPGPRPARGRAGGKAQRDHRGKPEVKPKNGAGSAPVFLWKGEWNETIGAVAAPGRHSRTGSPRGPGWLTWGPTMPICLLGSCWRGAFQGRWPRTCGRGPSQRGRETAPAL